MAPRLQIGEAEPAEVVILLVSGVEEEGERAIGLTVGVQGVPVFSSRCEVLNDAQVREHEVLHKLRAATRGCPNRRRTCHRML